LNIVVDFFEFGAQILFGLWVIESQFVSQSASNSWFDLLGVKTSQGGCFLGRVTRFEKGEQRGIDLGGGYQHTIKCIIKLEKRRLMSTIDSLERTFVRVSVFVIGVNTC
jgi:hypothetical protein